MDNREVKNERKKVVVQSLIGHIKKDSMDSKIKTNLVEGFRKPDKILRKGKDDTNGYVPDVISEKEGSVDLYEIEMSERDYQLEKWRLFSLYSLKSKGKFNIVTPKNKIDHLKDMLDEHKIHANIIYF